jgi:AcrR family transcriptional regulator
MTLPPPPATASAPDSPATGAREAILAAARRVIEQRGITGASMRAIALEAGLTTGAIVHHFNDKNALLLETLQSFFDPWFETLEAARALPNPWSQLERIFLATLPGPDHPRSRTQIWLAMLLQLEREERLWTSYQDKYRDIREEIYAIFARAQAEGFVKPDLDAKVECNRLLALSDGLVVSVLGEPHLFPHAMLHAIMAGQLETVRI